MGNAVDTAAGNTGVAMLDRRGVNLAPEDQQKIDQFRQQGYLQVATKKAIAEKERALEGCEWGSGNSVVRGSSFSPATRARFAEFLVKIGADPHHVDVFGSKLYTNAEYYIDRVTPDPYFISYTQLNVATRHSDQMRAQAKQAITEAKELGLPTPTDEVQSLLSQARELERVRMESGAPDWAKEVVRTVIRRYTSNAPIEAIARGEIADVTPFIREVVAYNWAGGKGNSHGKLDPIGDAEPAKTAETRSFRRCARKAFELIKVLDEAAKLVGKEIFADYEIIDGDEQEARNVRMHQNAITAGNGEPTAAVSSQPQARAGQEISQASSTTAAPTDEDPFPKEERDQLRRRYLGYLRDVGVTHGDADTAKVQREKWQRENGITGDGLAESSTDWTRAQFEKALAILEPQVRAALAPHEAAILDRIGVLGYESIAEYCNHRELGPVPGTVNGLQKLLEKINETEKF